MSTFQILGFLIGATILLWWAGNVVKANKIAKYGTWLMWLAIVLMAIMHWNSPYVIFSNDGPLGPWVHWYPEIAPVGEMGIIAFISGCIIGLPLAFIINRKIKSFNYPEKPYLKTNQESEIVKK